VKRSVGEAVGMYIYITFGKRGVDGVVSYLFFMNLRNFTGWWGVETHPRPWLIQKIKRPHPLAIGTRNFSYQ
jgi:hypothetical protein